MQSQVGVSWGLVKDVLDLKRRYDILGGYTHQTFIDAWHEEKMPFIICGLQSLAETIEFTEETYNVAKAYLNPPATYGERVFGMYLLNAFYNCQHLKGEVKVLVTLKEWNDLLELQQQFLKKGDDKAAFLFCLLRLSNAFVASASARVYGLEKNFRKYFNILKGYYRYTAFNYKNSQELVESDILSDYEKLRSEALALRETIMPLNSSVFSRDLTDMRQALQEVIYSTKDTNVTAAYDITQQPAETSEFEDEDIGKKRQKLKKKSFASEKLSPRHRRESSRNSRGDSSARSGTQSSSQESEPEARTSDSDYSPSKSTKKRTRTRTRTKKGKRGRPRKVVDE